jgi:hypothetical protein
MSKKHIMKFLLINTRDMRELYKSPSWYDSSEIVSGYTKAVRTDSIISPAFDAAFLIY